MSNAIQIVLKNGNLTAEATVPEGADVGHLRSAQYRPLLDEIGAPSSFTFSVNAQGVDDSRVLVAGDQVGFRLKQGEKGLEGEASEAAADEAAPEGEKAPDADSAPAGEAAAE